MVIAFDLVVAVDERIISAKSLIGTEGQTTWPNSRLSGKMTARSTLDFIPSGFIEVRNYLGVSEAIPFDTAGSERSGH
jgi:hypothetical protein